MVFTVLFFLCFWNSTLGQDVMVSRKTMLMGSQFSITLVDKDSVSANQNIDEVISEIDRIENLISEWRPSTQISEVNRNAGIKPVKVDREVFELTKRAIQYSEMTQGAFDISIIAMDKIWKFDDSMTTMPTAEQISNSVRNVGYQKIILNDVESTIFLSEKGMKIGFGSIGKGYAADKGRELMKKNNIEAGIVDASGDLSTWGQPTDDDFWKIGIKNPFKKHKMVTVLKLNDGAVATSGSYEKYAEINGKRYAHIINPKTGMPATGLTSVTILGPSTEFANALSTSIMVLGRKEGKKLLRKYPQYQSILISDKGRVIK